MSHPLFGPTAKSLVGLVFGVVGLCACGSGGGGGGMFDGGAGFGGMGANGGSAFDGGAGSGGASASAGSGGLSGGPGCPNGEVLCQDHCTSLKDDPLNCGQCDHACPGGVCSNATCITIEDCTATPCVGLSYCDLATKKCMPGCVSDSQCGENETCAIDQHACVCKPGFELEAGVCCMKNACGFCGPLPSEVCNGLDDDCNGSADDNLTDAPSPCDKQLGVCAGSKTTCHGSQGWLCDASVYSAYSSKYELSETSCDSLDNDCDGQVDEGLLNACGGCGTTPQEICNGLDDDCDGSVDENPLCAKCTTSPTPVLLRKVSSAWGITKAWAQATAMLADSFYMLAEIRGDGLYLYRGQDGQLVASYQPSMSYYDVSSITSGNGFLHVAIEGRPSNCPSTDCAVYYRLNGSGQVLESSTIGPSVFSGDGHTSIAWGGGAVGVRYTSETSGPRFVRRDSSGAWNVKGTPPGGDYGSHVATTSAGATFAVARSNAYNPSDVRVVDLSNGGSTTIDSSADQPMLRSGPDDLMHLVYPKNGNIFYTKRSATGTWSSKEIVDSGTASGIGFDGNGRPIVIYVQGTTTLKLAWRTTSGTWEKRTVFSATIANQTLHSPEVHVDSAGRFHVGLAAWSGYPYTDYDYLYYVMYCAN